MQKFLSSQPTFIRVLAKTRLRFGLQVRSKTETKPNFGPKRVCEEQSANSSVFDGNKLSSEIQIFLSTYEKTQLQKPTVPLQYKQLHRGVEESGTSRAQQKTGQVRLHGMTGKNWRRLL